MSKTPIVGARRQELPVPSPTTAKWHNDEVPVAWPKKEPSGSLVSKCLEAVEVVNRSLNKTESSRLLDFFSFVFLAFATLLVVLESNIVYWQIGAFSFSAYLTLITPIAFTFFLVFFLILNGAKAYGKNIRAIIILFVPIMAPWIALLAYGLLSLTVVWRLEGLQNVLVLAAFILGILVFAVSRAELVKVFVEAVFPVVAAITGILFILTQIVDTETRWGIEFFSPRQYAMVACVTLAAAITSPRKGWMVRVSPYIIFGSVLFSASRTAAVVAFLLLLTGFWLKEKGTIKRIKGVAGLILFAALTAVFASFTARDVAERLGEGGYEQTTILSDSGRFNAWQQFLTMPQSALDWVLGLGAGASAQFGQENLPHFPQTLNEYLRFLIDHGIVGLALFVGAIVLFLARTQMWRLSSSASQRAAGLAVVALALIAFTDGAFYSYFVVLPASVVIGHGLRGIVVEEYRKKSLA